MCRMNELKQELKCVGRSSVSDLDDSTDVNRNISDELDTVNEMKQESSDETTEMIGELHFML